MIFHLEKWVDGRPVTACGEVAKGFELADVPLRVTCEGCAKFIVLDPAPSSSEPAPLSPAAWAKAQFDKTLSEAIEFEQAVEKICRVAPSSRHAVIREVLQSLVFGPEKHVAAPASFSEMVRAVGATPAEVAQAKKTLARARAKKGKRK